MPKKSTIQAAKASFLPAMRELVRTYQAFSSYSEAHGLSMGEIGEKTLITKGTLTGVIDRLIKKQLVIREVPEDNRRNVIVQLTDQGQELFEQSFPSHIAYLKERFDLLEPTEVEALTNLLVQLRQAFQK
jgi:DNA-binding MarR family transcriptional regulator